jgi:DNA polymerase-3 subunit epsilon
VDFTAIDFETANRHRASACALGLAKVRDGVTVDDVSWLMRPPVGYDHFEPYQVGVHGISSSRVVGKPRFEECLNDILEFVGDDVVVAHNASFDSSVLSAACVASGFRPPDLRYLCTMAAARRCLGLASYRLPFVAEALGVRIAFHHDPGADAAAAAELVPHLAAALGVMSIEELLALSQRSPAARELTAIPEMTADPDHALFGKVIVFTGALSTMTRQMAWDDCAAVGARPEKNVTRRTQVLVVGELDPTRLVPGATLSARALKAFDLRESGQDIEVLTEFEFLQEV